MALNNIRREPQREITESLVGLVVVVGLVWGDYSFGQWVHSLDPTIHVAIGMFFGALLIILSPAVGFVALVGTHKVGEIVCDVLASFGLHLRPRVRPNGRR